MLAPALAAIACAPPGEVSSERQFDQLGLCIAPCVRCSEERAGLAHEADLIETARELYLELGTEAAHVGLAVLYREEGDLAASLTCAYDSGSTLELATTLHALELYEEAATLFCVLVQEDTDPATLYCMAAALRSAGHATEYLFREVAARAVPWDTVLLGATYEVLAQEVEGRGDSDQAARLYMQAEDYR